MTLYDATSEALDRLGDLENDIWSRDEVALYLQDGYDTFCRKSKILFDTVIIENLPPSGNWQTDLEKYFIQQNPGWGYTDSPIQFTDKGGSPERDIAGGSYGPQAVGFTNPGQLALAEDQEIPTTVIGGYLPQSTVEVLRVAYDNRDLLALGSQQARRIDPTYETSEGDPQYFTYDKDGLFFLRVVPAAGGDAPYISTDGGFGTLTQLLETQSADLEDALVAYWKMEESAYPITDSIGSNDIILAAGTAPSQITGKSGYGLQWDEAGVKTGISTSTFNTSEAFSIAFWFYGTASAGSWPVLSGNTVPTWLSYNATTDVLTHVGGTVGTATMAAGAWHHVVYNYDGAGTVTVYVNGELDITATYTHSIDEKMLFQYVKWDEFGVFSREITEDEIALLYNEGTGSFYPGMGGSSDTVVATEVSGATTAGYGILRSREGSDGWFPSGGPWGTPTRVHPDEMNVKVNVHRLGRPLSTHPMELPSAYQKYVLYWAMARALRRDGPGQDLALADHYEQRFEMGVSRLTHKRNHMQSERVGRFGGQGGGAQFGLGDPLLPSAYEYPWSN